VKVLCILVAVILPMLVAADEPLKLVEPSNSTLQRASYDEKLSVSKYTGQVKVAGTLTAKWIRGVDEQTPKTQEYLLRPDAESLARLPRFERYPLETISIRNGSEALAAAAGRSLARRFSRHSVEKIEIRGSYRLDQLEISVECDSPWANASFVAVLEHDKPVVFPLGHHDGCT
jgi:hypothetical protein